MQLSSAFGRFSWLATLAVLAVLTAFMLAHFARGWRVETGILLITIAFVGHRLVGLGGRWHHRHDGQCRLGKKHQTTAKSGVNSLWSEIELADHPIWVVGFFLSDKTP